MFVRNIDFKRDYWNPYNINLFVSRYLSLENLSFAEHGLVHEISWKTETP